MTLATARIAGTPERFLDRAQSALNTLSLALDSRPLLCMLLLTACTLPYTVLKARYTFFTCDEIYTLRIAQQPTIAQMLAVSRRIDLHPPLHYLLQRAALRLPVPIWLASRVPSLLATLGTMLCCFSLVRRRSGALLGLCAAATFWFTPGLEFAWLNRPYALWLLLLALLALSWQHARLPGRSRLLLLAVFVSAAAMVMDYMASLVCIVPFLLLTLLPGKVQGEDGDHGLDLPLVAALVLPCVGAFLYVRQVTDFATNSFAPPYLNWFSITLKLYGNLLKIPCTVLLACNVTTFLLVKHSRRSLYSTPSAAPRPRSLDSAAALVGVGLLAAPLCIACLAALRHNQLFARYGACGCVGLALLAPWILLRYTSRPGLTAALVAVGLVFTSVCACATAPFNITGPWRAHAAPGMPTLSLDRLDPSRPIVVARAVGYTEMNERESPSVLARTFYLYDRQAAERYSGSTIFETIATTAELLHYQTRTAPLAPFLAAHRSFYLIADVTHPEEWLPRYLLASGARLEYLGKFESTYQDDDLYGVTLP